MAKNNSKTIPDKPKELPGHTTQYDYTIDWIKEAVEARRAQNALVERAVLAYQGKPSANRYKGTINQYVKGMTVHDSEKAKKIQEACSDVPEKGSMVVHNAVEAVVSMAMGGVGQYEFGPYDPDMKKDSKTMDRLAAAAKSFYVTNKVDSLVPQYIRNAVLSGGGWWHVKQKNGKKCLTLLESSQMITDPKRFKTNFQRFIGYSQRESFQTVKERVTKIKGGGFVLKTLNEAQLYVEQIKMELNSVLQSDSTSVFLHDELRRDLDLFYQPITTRIQDRRRAKDGDPNYMYDGDEIECTYLYDEMNDMYFEIVNRRYIIVAKKNPLKRDIECAYYDDKGMMKKKTKIVKLDNPFIELPCLKTSWDTYAISPLFYILDDFDDLCAMESVLYHNLSIMAPITFVGQSSDSEKVSRVASVAGEVVEGLPQTFGVLNKSHDIGPVVTAIQRYEERIKRTLKAVDPFELQGMLGDRATAKEVVSASGQVAQGINQFLANIESAMATLGDKFIKLELIMNDNETYSFAHNGKYVELSREEMAGGYEVNAKLVSSIKLEQEANSRKAAETLQYVAGSEAVDKKEAFGVLLPIIFGSLVTREQAQKMVLPAYRPMPDEIIAAIKKRAEEDAKKDEVDKLDLNQYNQATIDQMIAQYSTANAQPDQTAFSDLNAPVVAPATSQPVAPPPMPVDPNMPMGSNALMPPAYPDSSVAAVSQPVAANGIPNSVEEGGLVANDQAGQGYA